MTKKTVSKRDEFTRSWIIENSLEEIATYNPGELTLRGLHYRLVSRGMTNTIQHYKRVCAALKVLRWDGRVDFDTFTDHDRRIIGSTEYEVLDFNDQVEQAKKSIRAWIRYYSRSKWEGQHYYAEVFIEKNALIGVFEGICRDKGVTLGACKGYPSITFLYDTAERYKEAVEAGHEPIMLYFGDYDPSGEDIPRVIEENLARHGVNVEVRRIALMKDQVIKYDLPPAPVKSGDSRSANWDGLGQVELDALEPRELKSLCKDAIERTFDPYVYSEVMEREKKENVEYTAILKEFVKDINY